MAYKRTEQILDSLVASVGRLEKGLEETHHQVGSLREDALARLDRFKGQIPLLLDNRLSIWRAAPARRR